MGKVKKNAMAKCGVFDWHAKGGQFVTCKSKVIWQVEVQTELDQGHTTQYVNM